MTSLTSLPSLDASIANTLATSSGTAISGNTAQSLMSLSSPSTSVSLSQTAVDLSMQQGIVSSLGGQSASSGIYDTSGLLQILDLPGTQTNQVTQLANQGSGAAMPPQTTAALSLEQGIVGTLPSP